MSTATLSATELGEMLKAITRTRLQLLEIQQSAKIEITKPDADESGWPAVAFYAENEAARLGEVERKLTALYTQANKVIR